MTSKVKTTGSFVLPRPIIRGSVPRVGKGKVRARIDLTSCTRIKVYLHPGQLFASTQPSVITTVLGSCVSLCLWDPVTMIGGMNHYILPFALGNDVASPRFGAVAIQTLIENVVFLGGCKDRLRAKLFGGACISNAFRQKEDQIGIVNARIAENILRTQDIPVVERDLAGRRGRKLIFNTDDGTSSVKYL
ncbi:MAG: chemotaxis protein CheD [Candidatus Binatia bacterium]